MALMAMARSGGSTVSGRIFLLRSVFSPKTLPLPAIRLKGIRQRKQATDGKSEDGKERLTDEAGYGCFIRKPFLFSFVESPLLRNHIGQTANCAPSRKSCACQPIGGAVTVSKHPFYVGLTVEDFAAQLDVGDASLVPIVLKRPAAHFQPRRYFLIGEETLAAQCRSVVGGQMLEAVQQAVEAVHEVDYPLVVLGH